jgi:RNA polymerase sigma-70 factor (ECF subfamily)
VTGQAFPDTHWSQLLPLRDRGHPKRRELLELLARRYWLPAYHYVRALRRVSAEEAEDVTQQFFAMLLARRDLERLSPGRGSFRGFLKTALRHFLISASRAQQARAPLPSFAEAGAAWRERVDPAPDEAFDRAWARAVLAEGIERLRRELRDGGRAAQLDLFEAYCLNDGPELTYKELAARHGLGEHDVRNRLREARQRLRIILRKVVREYLAPGEDVEEELAFVLRP